MSYRPDLRRREIAEDHGLGGKLPDKNLPPSIEVSPINFVPDIQTPVPCLGAAFDRLVPFAPNTGRLINLLKAHGKVLAAHGCDNAPRRPLLPLRRQRRGPRLPATQPRVVREIPQAETRVGAGARGGLTNLQLRFSRFSAALFRVSAAPPDSRRGVPATTP